MGLGHLLGLDDRTERWLCTDCGRIVKRDADASGEDAGVTCPNCGSTDLKRLQIL